MSPSLLLHTFPNRQQALTKIVRYHSFPVMFYRSNLWQHSQRLVWMIEEITPFVQSIYPNFNKETAQLIAEVHDDLEIVMGDIMLGEKLQYTPEQMADLDAKERAAIDEVAKMFPEMIGEYSYKNLLLRYQNLEATDLEAVIVKYCDKYDAFGEALHEVHAGNAIFTRPYRADLTAPIESYIEILQTFEKKYPLFEKLRKTKQSILVSPSTVDTIKIAAESTPHTLRSLNTYSEYTPYESWKQIILKHGGTEGKEWLIQKVE